jgi:multidrug resistance efflux pump
MPAAPFAIHVEDTIEALLVEHGPTSKAIYLATLVLTIATIAGAATTSVDLTIRAPATLAATVDRHSLRTLSDGTVDRVMVTTGSHVHAGDTLVTLASDAADRGHAAALVALEGQVHRRADLSKLLRMQFDETAPYEPAADHLLAQSQAIASAAAVEWQQNSVQVTRTTRVRDRLFQLMTRGFANPSELEAAEFELARTREDRTLALARRRSEWAEQIAATDQQIIDLRRDVSARKSEQMARYITAPVAGTVEEIMPLSKGSVVRAGDAIATISPDGLLIADALVAPKDVTFIKEGMPAQLLIEGYDLQEWGSADAVVVSIAHDYTLADGHPVFRVRLRPLHGQLERANGTTTQLRKGLHCQVRFLFGRKRITQLLQHRASEWLDPTSPNEH